MTAFRNPQTGSGQDKFGDLYTDYGDTMTALKGGASGKVLTGNGVGSAPTYQNPSMQFAFVNIGNWDMDTNTSVIVDIGIEKQYVRIISVMIFADGSTTNPVPLDSNQIFVSGSSSGGRPEIQGGVDWATINDLSTSVILSRVTGGIFDSTAYNQVSGFNRGIITIGHVTP